MVFKSGILTSLVEDNLVNIETVICIKISRREHHIYVGNINNLSRISKPSMNADGESV
jgi:hypothetical protein